MEILHADLGTCSRLTGTVVVIDVLRSFSTAAYAFAAGARTMFPVGTASDARELRARLPAALTMIASGRNLGFIVSYDSSVDRSGEESGFNYVFRFWEVAKLQLPKIGRLWIPRQAKLFGSGFAGLGG